MKRILLSLIVVLIVMSTIFAGQQATVTDWCNIRIAPSPTADVVTNAMPNQVVDIVDRIGDYYKVKAIEGTTKMLDAEGWIWVGKMKISDDKTTATIIDKGITMRTEPNKKGKVVGALPAGCVVKILDVQATWYAIAKDQWIYKASLKLK